MGAPERFQAAFDSILILQYSSMPSLLSGLSFLL